jgi:hypothetical protein
MYNSLRPSLSPCVSQLRSIRVSLHPQLSSTQWHPDLPLPPSGLKPRALPLPLPSPLQVHPQRKLHTTLRTHRSLQPQTRQKTTHPHPTRMLWPKTSVPLTEYAASTPVSRMLMHHRWTKRRHYTRGDDDLDPLEANGLVFGGLHRMEWGERETDDRIPIYPME